MFRHYHKYATARKLAGENRAVGDCPRMIFLEDFGRRLKASPDCFMFIDNGENSAALHKPQFDFNDGILAAGAAYWTRLVERELAPV